MQLAYAVIILSVLCASPPPEEGRELATGLPVETVDYVVTRRLDARTSDELLRTLFTQFRMRPRYSIAVFSLPGEGEPHLVFIKGKDAEVRLVKKMLTAMEEGSALLPRAGEEPFVMRYELSQVGAVEAKTRLIDAGRRIGAAFSEKDFFIYPEGPHGSLFFVGDPEMAPRVTEMLKGLDRAPPAGPADRAKAYAWSVAEQVTRAFGGLFATVVSALILLILHSVLGRLPIIGRRYRNSFRLFWESLFSSFKGKDLAWEIIQAAAGLGVSASGLSLPAGAAARAAADDGRTREERERAVKVALDYIRWRGLDPDKSDIRGLLDAAIDAAANKDLAS